MEKPTLCPVCTSPSPEEFLYRPSVPVFQNLMLPDQEAARAIDRGELRLMCCPECGFVFNAEFDGHKLGYDRHYDNRQTFSPVFQEHVERLVKRLVHEKNVRGCRIVEVGCGKGTFLRRLVEEDEGNLGFGFDPGYDGPASDLGGRLRFERRYYDERSADMGADVVVCRHVVEHVPDPVGLLRTIRNSLANSKAPRLFVEIPNVEWILRRKFVWSLFYEHCSYFSPPSLTTACQIAGLRVVETSPMFEGQYLWLEAVRSDPPGPVTKAPGELPKLAAALGEAHDQLVRSWREKLGQWSRQGHVALWGAAAKGTTFANLMDPECRLITCLVDVNPDKHGRYVPLSGHPIVPPAKLPAYNVTHVVIMNPNYRQEIERTLKEQALEVTVADLGD